MKEELTIQKATELKLTPIQCVKYYDEALSDEQADWILWNETCYPSNQEIMLEELFEYFSNEKKTA